MAPTMNDALLEELNGALAKTGEPTQIDKPGDQPPSLEEQLETKPRASASAPTLGRAANADKVHAKSAGGFGYRVVVAGEYYAKSSETKGNVVKKYELPFNLPSLINAKKEAPLGVIVGRLLKPALQKLDPLAITFRTHEIVSVTPLNGAPEATSISYMSFDALKAYVRESLPDFPIENLDEYLDVNHLREDVTDFKTNQVSDVVVEPGTQAEKTVRGGFGLKKSPSDRIVERHKLRMEERELLAMNEGLV